jgi:RNA polymerase primary sigma factor
VLAFLSFLRQNPVMTSNRHGFASGDEAEALNHYIQEIAKLPRLNPDEEKELGRRVQNGDEEALRRLVEGNLRFVVSYVKRYRRMGVSYLDLIHEGNLGLMEAARRFDPERNVKFISYAVWWIRQAAIQALSDRHRIFSVPARLSRAFGQIEKKFESESYSDGTPAPAEVAESLDVSVEDVNTFIAISGRDVSLSESTSEDGELELAERLEQETEVPVELDLIRQAFRRRVEALLTELGPKEAEVIRLRFGLGGEEPKTLQEIGDELHLTRERIRQIENKAMNKLRRSSDAKGLRGFLN